MKKHFNTYWPGYTFAVSLIFLLVLNHFFKRIILSSGLPFVVIPVICLVITGWWMLHLVGAVKIEHPLLKKITNKKYKKAIAFVLIFLAGYAMFKLDNVEMSPVSDIIISIASGYYWATGMFALVSYIKFRLNVRHKALTKKQFDWVTEYMEENQHFFIAEHNIRDIYTLKINFPAHLHKEITEMLVYYLKDPKSAYLISKIFRENVKLDKNNNVYINNKLETNPSKIGLFVMSKLSENSPSEIKVTITDIKG